LTTKTGLDRHRDAKRSRERQVQTRLVLAAELAIEKRMARLIAETGRKAAFAYARVGDGEARQAIAGVSRAAGAVLRATLTEVARTFAARLGDAQKDLADALETKSTEPYDRAIDQHVSMRTADMVVNITQSLQDAIALVISNGIDEQLGEEQIAHRIVEATSGEIGLARARRIARTEVHNAAMYGQQVAAEASPLAYQKEWLSTEDGRTRKGHNEMNGDRVALDAAFSVPLYDRNGELIERHNMLYPGATGAPASQVINCRCVVLYEPIGAKPVWNGPKPRPPVPTIPKPAPPWLGPVPDAAPAPVPVPTIPPRGQILVPTVPPARPVQVPTIPGPVQPEPIEVPTISEPPAAELVPVPTIPEPKPVVVPVMPVLANAITVYTQPSFLQLDADRVYYDPASRLGNSLPAGLVALEALVGRTIYVQGEFAAWNDLSRLHIKDRPWSRQVVVRIEVPAGTRVSTSIAATGERLIGTPVADLAPGERTQLLITSVDTTTYGDLSAKRFGDIPLTSGPAHPNTGLILVDAELIPFVSPSTP
jgi:Phage Mu protein F like protein